MSALERWGAPALIAVLSALAFAPALGADFVSFDDLQNIQLNHRFRGFGAGHLAWMFGSSHMGHYHPLTWLSLALDYELFGLDGPAFHRTNVALHAATAIAFYFLARRILRLAAGDESVSLAALGAALLFALHPLRVESVAWVTERRDVLAGLFFVLAVSLWLRWAEAARPPRALGGHRIRPRPALAAVLFGAASLGAFHFTVDTSHPGVLGWGLLGPPGLLLALILLGASLVAAGRTTSTGVEAFTRWRSLALLALLLSLLAKAWGIVLPAVLLVLDAWPLGRLEGERPLRRWTALVAEKTPVIVCSLAFMRLASWAQSEGGAGAMVSAARHGPLERLAQGFYGLMFYPWKTLLPAGLAPIYELPAELSLAQPRFLVPALAAGALTLALVLARRRFPAGLAAWAAYAAIVSPVLGVAQSGPQLVADRYSYLACLPFALLAGGGLVLARRRGGWVRRAALSALVLALALLALGTRARSRAWQSSTALWEAAYAVNPESPLTLLSLGAAREEAAASEADPGRRRELLREAEELLLSGFDLRPSPRNLSNLSRVHQQLAALEPERALEHRETALDYSRRALELASQGSHVPPDHHLNLGVDLLNLGRTAEALEHLETFAELRPYDFRGQLNLGTALGLSGRPGEAVEALRRAVELEPGSADAWGKLGVALTAAGEREEALRAFRRVLAIEPGHPAATRRLQRLERGP